jgi:hypothetical protein
MKTKSLEPFLTLHVDVGCKKQENLRKNLGIVPRLLAKTHDHKIMCVSELLLTEI